MKTQKEIFGEVAKEWGKIEHRVTPNQIDKLDKNEIFVFGSNMQGCHIGGAARTAYDSFGAAWGVYEGICISTYAIPTVSLEEGGHMSIEEIRECIDQFTVFAGANPLKKFLVTEIGCGIAGWDVKQIAPLFKGCMNLNNVYLPERFWECLINIKTK